MKNKIVAIVVTFNRKNLLEECVNALLRVENNENLDVLIVDNASTDGTEEMLKEKFADQIEYINTGDNLGGAGGFNFGIKYALNHKDYDYCWVMDDDTIVKRDTLKEFLNKVEELDGNFSFLSSMALWTDGNLCCMNVQNVSGKAIRKYEEISKGLLYVNYASFVSCFINADIIRHIGLPIKEFFIYGDDMEYTIRLNTVKPGYLVPKSVVVHKMKSNDGINIIDVESSRIERYFYNFRNLLYIYRKYDKKEYRNYKVKCYYMIGKCLLKAHKCKLKRAKVILKALKKHKKFNPNIEKI